MTIESLSKEVAVIVTKEPVDVGEIFAFPVPLPGRENDSFQVHGEVSASTFDNGIYTLRVIHLAGATLQDETIFNAYLDYLKSSQELEVISARNAVVKQKIQESLEKTSQEVRAFSEALSTLTQGLRGIAEELVLQRLNSASTTLH